MRSFEPSRLVGLEGDARLQADVQRRQPAAQLDRPQREVGQVAPEDAGQPVGAVPRRAGKAPPGLLDHEGEQAEVGVVGFVLSY